jgi:hypothetical protein
MWLVAVGFGVPSAFVAVRLLRERELPFLFGLPFRAYGGGFFERWPPEVFAVLLGVFAALSALELFAGYLLWHGERVGAVITVALLPIEVIFWAGFAVPIPPLVAVVRIALLAVGWSALR